MQESSPIFNRLRKNLKSRKNLRRNVSAFRLYEKDIPEYPYIIDIYNDEAVIYEKGKKIDDADVDMLNLRAKHLQELKVAISEILEIDLLNIHFKTRVKQQGNEQYQAEKFRFNMLEVKEYNLKFYVNLTKYLDTGLFLDHRPLRSWLIKESKGKKVLNLFSYTGSLSVAAAIGGAKTTTLDMSKTYLEWAMKNFELNRINLNSHEFYQCDLIHHIQNELTGKFDIILLDPPSFSNSKRMETSFNIQDDHVWMLKKLAKHLNKDGHIYFSNNYTRFKLAQEISEIFKIEDLTRKSIPEDFKNLKIHQCYRLTLI